MKFTIENKELSVTLDSYAGTIESIVDASGKEHYWQYDAAVWPRRTSVCFPFCGALKDGKYRFEGKEYPMPTHGFLRERELAVVSRTADSAVLELNSDESTREVYPFDFRFAIRYTLDGNVLNVEYDVTNTGEKDMYFSAGSHYTYALPKSQRECSYFFSKPQTTDCYEFVDGFSGEKTRARLNNTARLSMDGLFDVSSSVFDTKDLDTDYVAIGTEEGLSVAVSCEGFSNVVLWAPKGGNSPFACIECWAGRGKTVGHDGELVTKPGIVTLAPGKSYVMKQHIKAL